MTDMTVGLIGLGAMGGGMARRLIDKGFPPAVFDIDSQKVAELTELGARSCASPAEVAAVADVTLLSLPNSRLVEAVVLGPDGALAGARAGTVVVDMSSSDPDSTLALGERFVEAGVEFLDAPVSRGARAARDGTMSILVGGAAETLARVRPVLDQLGTDIVHAGPLGAGHAAKALNNHMSATALLAAMEGFFVAVKAGVDPELAVTAINQGSGRSHMTDVRFPLYYLPRQFTSNFALGLMEKDCRIAAEMAARSGRPMLLGALTSQLYRVAMNRGMGPADNTRVLELMEELLNARLSADPAQ
ncbi:3-hydroxyisobutyrate dehydrogenase-like beta-hydroxyacid dehydrogenase [Micromonospora profundi]|uniref:NAD(P)-dependent oxidoreductase n=1 Tax=Micromonospora profundi TaxID=1420889 RepID=UPI00143B9F11|nr:NAD(P)-dependent oxidoreductase [Micromonospora profundi]NJC12967.1 3-hydroxyisobutyrate dehydrogenase-like beta-hydroxyacid dehydrogenase [Micromonospora profundi]